MASLLGHQPHQVASDMQPQHKLAAPWPAARCPAAAQTHTHTHNHSAAGPLHSMAHQQHCLNRGAQQQHNSAANALTPVLPAQAALQPDKVAEAADHLRLRPEPWRTAAGDDFVRHMCLGRVPGGGGQLGG